MDLLLRPALASILKRGAVCLCVFSQGLKYSSVASFRFFFSPFIVKS